MLSINISELIWAFICFFLLYFLLNHFLYKPVIRHLDERKARADAAAEKEAAAQSTVESATAEIEAGKAAKRAEASNILMAAAEDDAKRSAEVRTRSIAEAQEQSEAFREQAKQEMLSDEDKLSAEGDALAELLAESITSKKNGL